MSRQKKTRPESLQAKGRAAKSNHMVAQDRTEARALTAYYLFLVATLLYGFLILLHDHSII